MDGECQNGVNDDGVRKATPRASTKRQQAPPRELLLVKGLLFQRFTNSTLFGCPNSAQNRDSAVPVNIRMPPN